MKKQSSNSSQKQCGKRKMREPCDLAVEILRDCSVLKEGSSSSKKHKGSSSCDFRVIKSMEKGTSSKKQRDSTRFDVSRSKEDEVAQILIELSTLILELQSRCSVIPLLCLWGRKQKRSPVPITRGLLHQHQHCFSQHSHSFGDFLAKEKQLLQLGDCSVLSIKSMEEGSPSKKHKGEEIVEKPELPLEFKEKFQEMVGCGSMEKGSSSKKSKGEIVDNAELPSAIKKKIQEMGGSEVKLVIQKSLFKTDLSPNHGRFSIPLQKMEKEAKNFLREREESIMAERQGQNNQRLAGLPVFVMDPSLKHYNMHLKKWKMEKAVVYNITHGWIDLVRDNNLQVNDTVQLWSFRLNNDQLCFAFVKL